MLFEYKWVPASSRGLCIKVVRESEKVKSLSLETNRLFGMPIDGNIGKGILNHISALIDSVRGIIFSSSSLMYRLEKELIKFGREVERAAHGLIIEVRREKEVQERLEQQTKQKKGDKKHQIDSERGLEGKRGLTELESRKRGILAALREVSGFIRELDRKIEDMRLEGRSQNREIVNPYMIREVTIRSDYRLGKVIKRRGIQFAILIKAIKRRMKYLESLVKGGERIRKEDVIELIKYCRKEANDLGDVFIYAIQLSKKLESRLKYLGVIISRNRNLNLLANDYNSTRKRLDELKGDIEVQQKRLSNEFKRRGFMPDAEMQREIKVAA